MRTPEKIKHDVKLLLRSLPPRLQGSFIRESLRFYVTNEEAYEFLRGLRERHTLHGDDGPYTENLNDPLCYMGILFTTETIRLRDV